ncbi:MAG TPA: NmrA family NAD(P)-binding protein [Pseudonocardia sp.]
MTTTVLLAGSTGMLGNRIAYHLLDQPEVAVRLLLRPPGPAGPTKARALDALVTRGGDVVLADVTDPSSLDATTAGADVVVSALQGRSDIIVDGQIALAESAVRSGVRRFLPSDFAIDLFAAPDGAPQFDMRKRADRVIDALPLQVIHVLNGAFMDMMLDPDTAGIVDLATATASVWGTGDEPFNLTTVEDTARFTANVATDPADLSGVRYLSGAETTFNTIIDETEHIAGITLRRNVLGSVEDLRRITADAKDPWSVIPQWYFLSMLTVPPFPTNDNERYPDAHPTGLHDYLVVAHRGQLHAAH